MGINTENSVVVPKSKSPSKYFATVDSRPISGDLLLDLCSQIIYRNIATTPTPVPAPPSTPPLSGHVAGPEVSAFRPLQTGRPTGSYGPPTTRPFQRFSTPSFHATPQAPPPHTSPVGQLPVLPPSVRPPPTMRPLMHMGSPPQSMNGAIDPQYISSTPNLQQTQSSVGPTNTAAFRAATSSAWPGYPATPSALVSHQGGYGPAPPQHTTFLLIKVVMGQLHP
ncbi:hypothetical protein L1987_76440 [Smallanthus sonchifolius]|uniref:Uncharacterized protein n=1 Tax=Smallanthus sonchifolius TaxID=185202 RepID=A0ACB8Z6T2_9ASTR|nr:hypothetical protein L1987_76440 [Smallanthus sonchifolius]